MVQGTHMEHLGTHMEHLQTRKTMAKYCLSVEVVLLNQLHRFWSTCLFTRLESLARSQQGFWQLSFCRNCSLWNLCCDGRTSEGLLCLLVWMNGKVLRSLEVLTYPLFLLCKQFQIIINIILPSKRRLLKLQFLQKLRCQKPCLDQARLSNLVNKRVEMLWASSGVNHAIVGPTFKFNKFGVCLDAFWCVQIEYGENKKNLSRKKKNTLWIKK